MPFKYCPKCHKVFYWLIEAQAERWCPNCYDWRIHNLSEDRVYVDDIELKPLPFLDLLEHQTLVRMLTP